LEIKSVEKSFVIYNYFNVASISDRSESRRLNLLMEIASMLAFMDPEEALKMTADVQEHPRLHRVRGWALLNADRFDDAVAEFEKGFSEGDVACGVYAHRKLREDGRNPEKFDDLETALLPYFNRRKCAVDFFTDDACSR
jgi:hypothetical protein